jgi:hypothetical protein
MYPHPTQQIKKKEMLKIFFKKRYFLCNSLFPFLLETKEGNT